MLENKTEFFSTHTQLVLNTRSDSDFVLITVNQRQSRHFH